MGKFFLTILQVGYVVSFSGKLMEMKRDFENPYNANNFVLLTEMGYDVGYMPAELCNAIAPLYDCSELKFIGASVSYVEPISKRSRYAKQAVLFAEPKLIMN